MIMRTALALRRARYFCVTLASEAIGGIVLLWFIAPYVTVGVDAHLPRKTPITIVAGILMTLVAGLVRRAQRPPPPFDPPILGRRWFWVLFGFLFLVGTVSLARFTLPAVWRGMPVFGARLGVREMLVWYGLLLVSATLSRTLPLFMRSATMTADQLLESDPRRPVLYFRSFEKESQEAGIKGIARKHRLSLRSREGTYLHAGDSTFYGGRGAVRGALGVQRSMFDEQMVFAQAFSAVGPYIALGRPTEDFRNMDLGAAKKYVAHDEWQGVVTQWLGTCAAVVVEAAASQSLAWELEEIVKIVPAPRVLLICPRTDEEDRAFWWRSASLFPVSLPETRPTSRLLIFDDCWRPEELENVNVNAAESLQPFFERVKLAPRTTQH